MAEALTETSPVKVEVAGVRLRQMNDPAKLTLFSDGLVRSVGRGQYAGDGIAVLVRAITQGRAHRSPRRWRCQTAKSPPVRVMLPLKPLLSPERTSVPTLAWVPEVTVKAGACDVALNRHQAIGHLDRGGGTDRNAPGEGQVAGVRCA